MYLFSQATHHARTPYPGSTEDREPRHSRTASDPHIRQLNGFIADILPLIREYARSRTADPIQIATLLNYRGMPCYGQSKWTGTFVRMILARDHGGHQGI